RIIVIGGGNVAYDVARSAVRPHDEHVAYDVARSALRLSGDKEVHVVCLESRAEMPADELEVHEGAEEGIHLHNQRGPRAISTRCWSTTATRCTSASIARSASASAPWTSTSASRPSRSSASTAPSASMPARRS